MERHFILPATIAAALHAGLLFGIRSGHDHDSTVAGPVQKIIDTVQRFELIPTPPEPPEETVSGATAGGSSGEASVTLDEYVIAPPKDAFVFTKPQTEPGNNLNPEKISFGPPGLGDTIGNVGPRVVSSIELDGAPRARVQASPAYPPEARQTGLAGEVVVEFTVDESGAVLDPRTVRSTSRVFEEPALRAVARWRFEPGLRGGRPVRFRMAVPIVFKLDEP
jgi:protein TonB